VIQDGGGVWNITLWDLWSHSFYLESAKTALAVNKPTIVPVYKNGDKTSCNSYWGILLLPTLYKIYSIPFPQS
jgi:hypothetical protein